ncbi:MAG: energy transducer TonB [Acidobacteriaceae bacterium]|nr:energy transducer TonB [Acidobacteriaceae bacterium]
METPQQNVVQTAEFNLQSGSLSLKLRFSSDALHTIKLDVGKGFIATAKGAEVGGVLEGAIAFNGTTWAVTINRVCPIPVQSQSAPSPFYDSGLHSELVGWFRSNTRPEQGLDDGDRHMSEKLFGRRPSVFLLCQPSEAGGIAATCFILAPEQIESAFPFELGRIPVMPARFGPRGFISNSHNVPNIASGRILAIAATVLSSAVLVFVVRARAPNVSAEKSPATVTANRLRGLSTASPQSFGLKAAYEGNALMISWNRYAFPLASARAATLALTEGGHTRVLDLSARELQTGSVLYRPSTDEVSVQMDVIGDAADIASESIRIVGATVIRPEPPGASVSPQAAEQHTVKQQPELVAGNSSSVVQESVSPVQETRRMQPSTSGIDVVGPLVKPGGRFGVKPAFSTRSEPLVTILEPPDSLESVSSLAAQGLSSTALPDSSVLLPPVTIPQRSAGLSQPEPTGSQAAPPIAEERVRKLQPAIPIRSPQPVWPGSSALPEYVFDRLIEVQIELTISSTGAVTHAALTSEAGPYASVFGPSALDAARRWMFRPAKLGGEPVQSKMTITFRYSRHK